MQRGGAAFLLLREACRAGDQRARLFRHLLDPRGEAIEIGALGLGQRLTPAGRSGRVRRADRCRRPGGSGDRAGCGPRRGSRLRRPKFRAARAGRSVRPRPPSDGGPARLRRSGTVRDCPATGGRPPVSRASCRLGLIAGRSRSASRDSSSATRSTRSVVFDRGSLFARTVWRSKSALAQSPSRESPSLRGSPILRSI